MLIVGRDSIRLYRANYRQKINKLERKLKKANELENPAKGPVIRENNPADITHWQNSMRPAGSDPCTKLQRKIGCDKAFDTDGG